MASRAQRWAMGLGVLASLMALGGLWQLASPPSAPPAPSSAPPRSPLAAAPVPAALPAAPVTPTLPTPALPAAPDASSVPAPAPVAAPTAVGSEGYGARIQQALNGSSAEEAFWAARRLRECTETGWDEHALKNGAGHQMSAAGVKSMIEADRAEARLCQTVTPDLMAQRAALAERAAQAGVMNAAWEWSDALGLSYRQAPSPERLPALRDALLADAARCSRLASSLIALSDKAWGFSDADRGLHLRVNLSLGGLEASPRMVMQFQGGYREDLQALPGVQEAAADYQRRCTGSWEKLG